MEIPTQDASANQAELDSLLSQIQTSLQNANQISSLMRKQDYCEIRACHVLPNQVSFGYAAALCAVYNIKIQPINSAVIKQKIGVIPDFSHLVKNFDIVNLHLNNDQINYIQNIYSNNSDLTTELRNYSTFTYHLSAWTEAYVDISIKANRIKDLKRMLGIN